MSEGTKDGGLTGQRRFVIVHVCSDLEVLALQVEYSVWQDAEKFNVGRWVNKWRFANPEDIQDTIVGVQN